MTASCAWGVPATDGSTTPRGWVTGILAKSAGNLSLGTYVHGPVSIELCRNQRPEMRTYWRLVAGSTMTLSSVFATSRSDVPAIGSYEGAPRVMMSSAGTVLT